MPSIIATRQIPLVLALDTSSSLGSVALARGETVALAESCILAEGKEIGAKTDLSPEGVSKEAFLFGESQNRVVISVSPEKLKAAEDMIKSMAYPHRIAGKVGGSVLEISSLIKVPLMVLKQVWRTAIGGHTPELHDLFAIALHVVDPPAIRAPRRIRAASCCQGPAGLPPSGMDRT